tara:strand:- start:1102 stop:1287 length:186 start_codon:yes stop_codon:yes gene_type:complete
MDPADTSSPIDPEMVASSLPALGWARILLFAKQHGVVAALCLMMAYQVGVIAQAQSVMCGV